ncbi:hypothetical protein FM125_00445 [Micrococcus lylae]|uniref:Uncharacterized protein n=1 Tax=Micrococcus lylae TaxID=1273 RepID=A0A1R4I7E5_9MICC|nr:MULTISPECIES: hypothetical protein [Micrococcus]WIK81425.1 hypothetical protein CJ228_007355 [Micrococcus lylae]SJN15755.1 hypothetical protein FM125_00445 [Micrococcus lylae]
MFRIGKRIGKNTTASVGRGGPRVGRRFGIFNVSNRGVGISWRRLLGGRGR